MKSLLLTSHPMPFWGLAISVGVPAPAVMSVLAANVMLPGAFVVYRTVNGVTTARAKRLSSCSVRRR